MAEQSDENSLRIALEATSGKPSPGTSDRSDRFGDAPARPDPSEGERVGHSAVGEPDGADIGRKRRLDGYPEAVERRYYVLPDQNGGHRIYADSRAEKEVFRDFGDALKTDRAEPAAIHLMIETAEHRGWDSIEVSGTEAFRREAWLEASARGLSVRGHQPSELDGQELLRRERAHANKAARDDRLPATRDSAAGEPGSGAAEAARSSPRVDYRSGLEGVVLGSGRRPYRDDPKGSLSPYVEIELADGKTHTAWGVGLPDALARAGVAEGDRISLRKAGVESVTKTVRQDVDGKTTTVERSVQRRGWEAKKLEREEAAQAPAALVLGPSQNALHASSGRDAAFEGRSANEGRARAFLEHGRSAPADPPELRSAVALELYVDRQLQRQFRDNPNLIARGVEAARTKIADMIRHGADLRDPDLLNDRPDSPIATRAVKSRSPEAERIR